jgi:hypothetical protein
VLELQSGVRGGEVQNSAKCNSRSSVSQLGEYREGMIARVEEEREDLGFKYDKSSF